VLAFDPIETDFFWIDRFDHLTDPIGIIDPFINPKGIIDSIISPF
jgi:hypothetical protein